MRAQNEPESAIRRMLSRRRMPLFIFLGWTIFGVASAVQSHYRFAMSGRSLSWGSALLAEVSYAWLWALATPLILKLGRAYPLTRNKWLGPLLLHAAAAVLTAMATKLVWDFTVMPLVFLKEPARQVWPVLSGLLMTMDYGLLQYGIVLVAQHMLESLRRAEESRLRATRLEAELARAQLSALKMQLHPHFLFNTLNAVTELIEQEPAKAERMIVHLSDLLRYTIDQFGVQEVKLQQEIEFLRRYLEIEQIRFEDRLQVEYSIDPSVMQAEVPNFLLQPIVENALRHGIEAQNRPGLLRIGSHAQNGTLTLEVFDSGPGTKLDAQGGVREGVGLGNTRRRLEHLFGSEFRMKLTNVNSGGFAVTLDIPLRLSSEYTR